MAKFGINELTDIDLPGEVRGNINNLKNGKEIDFATVSFGQGVAVTPIRLISAISAIANGGVLMKPLISADDKPEVARRIVSKDSAHKVIEMMVSAVKKILSPIFQIIILPEKQEQLLFLILRMEGMIQTK